MLKLIILNLFCSYSFAGILVKEVVSPNNVLSVFETSYSPKQVDSSIVLRNLPMFMGEQDYTSKDYYRETLYPEASVEFISKTSNAQEFDFSGSEVRTIISQGPDANRIVLTILGDGYTESEKEKFFEDVKFMVEDLFIGVTFKSYLPFFNIYAVFTPSKESGITDVEDVDTIFGLYRSPTGSKRAIMPGSTNAIEAALRLAPAPANYPIILANDNFYGGLGGRYAITSRSRVSGAIVLRHELGHNFSNVGEEYDGGQVYSGANFSRTGTEWNHWKKSPGAETFNSSFIFGAYVWSPLTKPFVQDFVADSNAALFGLKISSVGWDNLGDVEILLDGKQLTIDGHYTPDRSFFDSEPFSLKPGKHQLVIRSNGNRPEHILAFANGYAYPANYDFKSGEIKAFNNFNDSRTKVGYRPTENTCLMRNMLSNVFCSVDKENIWLQFLMRVSLIDSLSKKADGSIELETIPFDKSNLDISWFENNLELMEYRGQKIIPARPKNAGSLKAVVKLSSPEIRLKSSNLQDEKTL